MHGGRTRCTGCPADQVIDTYTQTPDPARLRISSCRLSCPSHAADLPDLRESRQEDARKSRKLVRIKYLQLYYLYLHPCAYKSLSVCPVFPPSTMSSPPQGWASGSTTTTARSTDSTPPTSTSSHSQPLPLPSTRYHRASTDKPYPGSGTPKDPFVVDWALGDPENPFNWSRTRRWFITAQVRCPLSFALVQ